MFEGVATDVATAAATGSSGLALTNAALLAVEVCALLTAL